MDEKEQLITKYYSYGLHQKEILQFLKHVNNISISLPTLKRILKKLNLFRRKKYTSIVDVVKFLQNEVNKSGQMHGYRWMRLKCLQNGIVVTQEVVRELLKSLDPLGVEIRSRKRLRRRQYYNKGPNYLWHTDSYDKLKPFGICINGCIDGYSRHIIWLNASSTSNDPKVVAGYYVKSIKTLGGCPETIRSDMGTENKVIEKIQRALHHICKENNSVRPPFIYGRSTANQRIESWWSILQKQNAQYWLNLFNTLKDENLFNGTFLDKSLIQFCFLELIQDELDDVVMEWNVHKIRQSRNCISPSGRHVIMFQMPNLYGTRNYLIEVPEIMINILESECIFLRNVCDIDVLNICNDLIVEKQYTKPNDPYDAVQLYVNLRRDIMEMLEG